MTPVWFRHQLAYLHPAAWHHWLIAHPEWMRLPLLHDWAACGRPLIIRRSAAAASSTLALGLPLPAPVGKQRIAVDLPPQAIAATAMLPRLANCIAIAPTDWQPGLRELEALGQRHGVVTRVFGSLAWQQLTGLAYITSGSDLDLLWSLPPPAALADLLPALDTVAAKLPCQLDGEFLKTDGSGVHWRELQQHAALLAVKRNHGVSLCKRADFLNEPT